MSTVALPVAQRAIADSDDTGIDTLVPVLKMPTSMQIPFTVLLVSNGGATGSGSAHFTDILSPNSSLNVYKQNYRSLRVVSARLIVSCSASIAQNCDASIVGCMIPNQGPSLAPATAAACVAFQPQSFQANITNAGNTFASNFVYPLQFGVNGITDQLMPTGNIGNQFPPAFRFFITLSNDPPTLGANELGVLVLLQGLVEPSGTF